MFVGNIVDLDPKLIPTSEIQALDLNKRFRPHLILAKARLHGNQQFLTVVPFQTPTPSIVFRVQVGADSNNNLSNDSWVICCQLLTLPSEYFARVRGQIDLQTLSRVRTSVKAFLAIY